MRASRQALPALLMLLVVGVTGCLLWMTHAAALGLGRRSLGLDAEAARTAVAARELAYHGRVATPFALPVTLVRNPRAPWPLDGVEPGMWLLEAGLLAAAPATLRIGGVSLADWTRPDQLEWLLLPLAFTSFLFLGFVVTLGAYKLLLAHARGVGRWACAGAAVAAGLQLLADPETQHVAVSGRPDLMFALGLIGSIAALSLGLAGMRPLVLGVMVAFAVSFRVSAVWVGPLVALAAAATARPEHRLRIALLTLAGFVLPLVPWWIYQVRAFGFPIADTLSLAPWDRIGGRSWLAMVLVSEPPQVPAGPLALLAPLGRALARWPGALLAFSAGPRALWLGAVAVVAFDRSLHRNLRVAARAVLAVTALSLLAAGFGPARPATLLPARLLVDASGLIAVIGLAARLPELTAGTVRAGLIRAMALVLAVGWGAILTGRGIAEVRLSSRLNATPGPLTMLQVSVLIAREVPDDEPLASNLGANLVWYARQPVVQLPLAPEDLERVRERVPIRSLVLVFRDASQLGPGWESVASRPLETRYRSELAVERVREFRSADGFRILWLDLGPLEPRLAAR